MKDVDRTLPPARFDFVILTVNDVETSEAVTVFKLTNDAKEFGLNYRWGMLQRRYGPKASVALVSFNDKQGVAEAINRTNEILQVLKPQYILMLGIAGGLQKNDSELAIRKGIPINKNEITGGGMHRMCPRCLLAMLLASSIQSVDGRRL